MTTLHRDVVDSASSVERPRAARLARARFARGHDRAADGNVHAIGGRDRGAA